MAQLKSFRFIEPDSHLNIQPTSHGRKVDSRWQNSQTNSTNSIPSTEEYQVAQVDFQGNEEEAISEAMSIIDEDPETAMKMARAAAKGGITRASTSESVMSNQINKYPGRTMKAMAGESVSQTVSPSYNLRMTSSNCFEIQWRYLHLYSRKSKVPRFISDNFIYKLFAGKPKSVYNDKNKFEDLHQASYGMQMRQNSSAFLNDGKDPLEEFSSPEEYRQILNNVSGSVYSGQLTAILGPSGVGKSTLLNTLTGRNQLYGVGRVKLIGCAEKRVSVVFVPQMDVLPGRLTTMEDLRFTSRLKNPKFTHGMHERNIGRVVKLLHLEKFLHTRINKLSGGQERRLSIARELLSSPDIMILDEPTSGLDANTCKKIIQALRDLVEHSETYLGRPMSVIVTIHQPQREVYNLFHRINVMAMGGRVIYEGSPGDLMPTFLENSPLAKIRSPDQLNENPAIVALEVASGEYGAGVLDELALYHQCQCDDFVQSPTQSPYGTPRSFMRSPKTKSKLPNSPMLSPHISKSGKMSHKQQGNLGVPHWDVLSGVTNVSYASSYDAELPEPIAPKVKVDKRLRRSVVMKGDFLRQTWTLMQRTWLLSTRDMFLMCVRVFGFVLVGLGMVSIFMGPLDPTEHSCPIYQSDVEDVPTFLAETRVRLHSLSNTITQTASTGLFLFHLVLFILMVSAALGGLMFPLQIRMFLREYKNGWYSPASFITSITLAELPVDFLGPAITVMVAYPLCNQLPSLYEWRQVGYAIIIILCSIICKSQAHIAGAFLMDSIENSVFVSCVLVIVPVLTSDIPIRLEKLPHWLQVTANGSYLKWAFDGLFLLRYGFGMCPCDPEVVHGFPMTFTQEALPPHLTNLAQYLLESNTNVTVSPEPDDESVITRMVRLTMESANAPLSDLKDLGDCNTYRSLILIQKHIGDNDLPLCLLVLVGTFIFMRIVVYFCVRAVIKLKE